MQEKRQRNFATRLPVTTLDWLAEESLRTFRTRTAILLIGLELYKEKYPRHGTKSNTPAVPR